MRGIRGAITVEYNNKTEIWQAAKEMVSQMLQRNDVAVEDIGALIFSCTEDITAAFPTAGVRQLPGFDAVPLFDTRQMGVDSSLPMCIRALLLVDSDKPQREIRHVYLGRATGLRPDISEG